MKPKYLKVFDNLLLSIENQTLKPGSLLPSEMSLMQQFQASRDTIRKALQRLQAQGYIQKVMGKGSIVIDKDPISLNFSGIHSFKEVAEALPESQIITHLSAFDAHYIPSQESSVNLFLTQLKSVDPFIEHLLFIERIREINGEAIILDEDYLNPNIIQGLTPSVAQNSLYEYIEQTLELKIAYAKREITVIPAGLHDKEALNLGSFDFLICVTSLTYLEDTRLFQLTRSKHRPDKFKFVEFARR